MRGFRLSGLTAGVRFRLTARRTEPVAALGVREGAPRVCRQTRTAAPSPIRQRVRWCVRARSAKRAVLDSFGGAARRLSPQTAENRPLPGAGRSSYARSTSGEAATETREVVERANFELERRPPSALGRDHTGRALPCKVSARKRR